MPPWHPPALRFVLFQRASPPLSASNRREAAEGFLERPQGSSSNARRLALGVRVTYPNAVSRCLGETRGLHGVSEARVQRPLSDDTAGLAPRQNGSGIAGVSRTPNPGAITARTIHSAGQARQKRLAGAATPAQAPSDAPRTNGRSPDYHGPP